MNPSDFFFPPVTSTFTIRVEEESCLHPKQMEEMFKIRVLVIEWESSVCQVQ